ncbi:MAG: CBS domain-containing protein [Deltaproteobacteria bacterium]|nr:MAG: CBS domain-containing protein [Deltaproteobacteria bacterium]
MDACERRVSEVMQSQMVTLKPDERLDLADDIMHLGRVRHMPVVEEGRLIGIVSNRDLLAASLTKFLNFDPKQRRAFLHSVEAGEAMTRDVITVEPSATLREAAQLMIRHKVGCLPVVKPDGILVGLVTETDLLRATLLEEREERSVDAEEP